MRRQDDKRVRQIHLLWRDRGSCLGPMAYSKLAGMMSKALEQLQMFKGKVGMLTPLSCCKPACFTCCWAVCDQSDR